MSPRPRLERVRKAQIRAAAADLIAERGLAATRVESIAARAGTSKAAVLYWFSNKDELLTEALTFQDERFYAELAARIDSLDSGYEQMRLLVDTYMSSYDYRLWMELLVRAMHDPVIDAMRHSLDRRWRRLIADTVRFGQRNGEFGLADADAVALGLATLLDGLRVQVTLQEPGITSPRAADLWLAAAEAWLTPTLFLERDARPSVDDVGLQRSAADRRD
jgi:AcrR family transcriptional regulator